MAGLELWGGHECTVNRVGDTFRDQTRLSGHHERLQDLELFASLGIKRLRYPVLWERVAPNDPAQLDFGWSDVRLSRLAQLGLNPIVGLVHHGGGPSYTNLLDPEFAQGLGAFARQVAERYPHVEHWTPVNEPLTTARFSCLYGHWFPHRTDEPSFWLALLNQIDAVRLAMSAIRAVNAKALLVQTEDFGRTYASQPVEYQADFDNGRRWMTWDLLAGLVTQDHPFWERLERLGLGDRLRAIADDPCPADVIGINHYLTSERFLDHRIERYPEHLHGGNGRSVFADVEAVRIVEPAPFGLEGAMREVLERYGRPVAVTECHNACTREEQLRWLVEAWETASALQKEGHPVQAVTAWSLLGAHDWDSLLTTPAMSYEPGVFDIRGPAPRSTALARVMKSFTSGVARPPASYGAGWWRRPVRLEYAPARIEAMPPKAQRAPLRHRPSRPLLITGATGTLGRALARACDHRGLAYVLTSRQTLDLGSSASVSAALELHQPWAVINAAGWVDVDAAELNPRACFEANADGVARLAQACQRHGAAFVGFSTDLVFDGDASFPYTERDLPNPLNAYGRSKLEAEQLALETGEALMIRTAAFFSSADQHNFAAQIVRALLAGKVFQAATDVIVSPTYVPDLVRITLDLTIDGARDVWHLANEGSVSWYEFARALAVGCGLPIGLIEPCAGADLNCRAQRPSYAVLGTQRGLLMPSLDLAIARYCASQRSKVAQPAALTPVRSISR